MKIVQLINSLEPAGAERVMADLSRGLAARGHEVRVVTLQPLPPTSPVRDDLDGAGIPYTSLEVTKSKPWRIKRLQGEVAAFAPGVVHAHLFHSALAARLTVSPRETVRIDTNHGIDRQAWRARALALTWGRIHRMTAVSEAVARDYERRIGLARGEIVTVPNGIHPPAPLSPEERVALRREWGFDDTTIVLGGVGRLYPEKGFDRLLALLSPLAGALHPGERVGVVLLGEGPERARLEALAAAAPAGVTVHLPGFRADAARAAGAFDVFVMPSRWEGYGLVLAEAMTHGLPAVVQPVDSIPEVIAGYAPGRQVDFTDPDATVAALLAAGRTPGTRSPRVRNTVDDMVEGYLAVYAAAGATP